MGIKLSTDDEKYEINNSEFRVSGSDSCGYKECCPLG
jgi:hypothetical protein